MSAQIFNKINHRISILRTSICTSLDIVFDKYPMTNYIVWYNFEAKVSLETGIKCVLKSSEIISQNKKENEL